MAFLQSLSGSAGKGFVVGTFYTQTNTEVALSGAGTSEAIALSFNRIRGDTHFIVWGQVNLSSYTHQANTDNDNPRVVWQVNNSNVSTRGPLTSSGIYFSDVPRWYTNTTYNGSYEAMAVCNSAKLILSGSANDTVRINLDFLSGANGLYSNRPKSATNQGLTTFITCMEIQ